MPPKLKALLATGRVSNLPTVWCNAIAATIIIIASNSTLFNQKSLEIPSEHPLLPLSSYSFFALILLLSTSLIYIGGCFLGDAIDAKFDKTHKPDRPIPSGILSAKTILITSILMLAAGTISPYYLITKLPPLIPTQLAAIYTTPILTLTTLPALTLAVVLYSILHKKLPILGLPLIGLCRFFLITASAGIAAWTLTSYNSALTTPPHLILPIIIFASAVCIYTIAFASVARTEASDSPITWRNLLRYTMLALPLTTLFTNQSLQPQTITALIIYALWLSYAFSFLSTNKGKYVSKCLAGFCLLDACFIAHFGWTWLIACLILFTLALAFQKIAPAT